MDGAQGTLLEAIHNEMKVKKLLISNSDTADDTQGEEIERVKKNKKPLFLAKKKATMSRNQSKDGSMSSGVHSACEHDMHPDLGLLSKNHHARSRTKPKRSTESNGTTKGMKPSMSSSSGEDEDQLPQLDCGLGDTELVFMTEQLNRLRSREKRQKIAEARLTVTEAKLMEFAAKLAARKSKVEENHARLKNRKNRIREKEEKIRELETELNALDGEIKSKSDLLKERETKLKTQESGATEKDEQLKQREIDVSEKLKQIEQRQRIVEKKETMIREMSQLLISQEMSSTRELNFHTRRFNRYGDERKHASDEEVYDTFSRSKSALDLTKNLQMASVWDVEYNNNNGLNHGHQFASSQENKQNMQQLLTQPHAKYEPHSIQDIEPSTSGSSNKKQKNGFQRMFANMKKSKSMDKLNTAEMLSTSREIDMGSDSHGAAHNSGNESPKKSPKNGKSKKGIPANGGVSVPDPPMRVSSMDSRHIFQTDKGIG